MTSLVAHSNRLFGRVSFDDTGASFSVQPMSNMSETQLPLFAQFTGATAEFDVTALDSAEDPETFSADVFGVLGHTLDDGAVVEFLDGSTSLGSVTVANNQGLPQHAILVLDSPVSLDTLTVKITNADGGRIGAVWASPSFRTKFSIDDFGFDANSLSDLEWASATGWANRRASQDTVRVTFPWMSKAEAIGPAWPNWRAIARIIGIHSPVIVMPDNAEMGYSLYGRVESFPSTQPQPTPMASHWRGGVNVIEEG